MLQHFARLDKLACFPEKKYQPSLIFAGEGVAQPLTDATVGNSILAVA
jgi:hypothetical protein